MNYLIFTFIKVKVDKFYMLVNLRYFICSQQFGNHTEEIHNGCLYYQLASFRDVMAMKNLRLHNQCWLSLLTSFFNTFHYT
jgi:hypothetical protein